MFGRGIRFIGKYTPEDMIRDAMYYELTYRVPQGTGLRFVLVIGEQLLLHAAGLMFGTEFYAMNDMACFAIREIAQSLIQRAAACFEQDSGAYQLERDRFLDAGEYHQMFQEHAPQYGLLFAAEQECFALCVDQLSPQGQTGPIS